MPVADGSGAGSGDMGLGMINERALHARGSGPNVRLGPQMMGPGWLG